MSSAMVESAAGQTLLQLSSRGNSIIADLLRLSDHVPPIFYDTTRGGPSANDPKFQTRKGSKSTTTDETSIPIIGSPYQYIIFDFKYLTNSELYETRIENSAQLLELDAEFREEQMELLKRFYQLFES